MLAPLSETPSSQNSDATLIYGSLDSERRSPVVEPAVPDLAPAFRAQPTVRHYAMPVVETPRVSGSQPTSRLLVAGVLAIAVLLLVGIGIGAILLFRQSGQDQSPTSGPNVANVNQAESASPTSSREGTSTTKPLSNSAAIESEQNPKYLPLNQGHSVVRPLCGAEQYLRSCKYDRWKQRNCLDRRRGWTGLGRMDTVRFRSRDQSASSSDPPRLFQKSGDLGEKQSDFRRHFVFLGWDFAAFQFS